MGREDFRRVAEVVLLITELCVPDDVAATGSCLDVPAPFVRCALTVELEDDVDDSRTGGKELRVASFDEGPLLPGAG